MMSRNRANRSHKQCLPHINAFIHLKTAQRPHKCENILTVSNQIYPTPRNFWWPGRPWSLPGTGATKKDPPPTGSGSESCRVNVAGTRARTPKLPGPGRPPGSTSGAQPTRRARRGNRSTRTNRHGSDPNPTRHRRRAAASAGRRWADTGQSVCDRDHI